MGFLAELRQRKVFQIALGYLALSWLAVQVADIALGAFHAPDWVLQTAILLFALGFPIALLMAWALQLTPDGVKVDMDRKGGRRMLAITATLVALALGWYFRDGWPVHGRGTAPGANTAEAKPAPVDQRIEATNGSIAVLAFADLSPERDQGYLSDGLSEEILNQLAQIEGLDVRARTSSFAFKGKNEDMRVVGERLQATHLLEGSVRKDGERLRITAQLIRARDASHVWSKAYDGDMGNIFAMQEQVARDVATALSIKLDVGDLSRATGGTTNVAAYEKFLQGRAAKASIDDAGGQQSVELWREAVQLDPNFGAAWVSLVQSLYDLPGSLEERPREVEQELAGILARNLRNAPEAPWTQHLLAYDHLAHYRWAEADAALARVSATPYGSRRNADPWANPPIYLKWARFFATGRAAEAFQLTERWVVADPLSLYASTVKLMFLPYLGRDSEVAAELSRSRGLDGYHGLAERTALLHMLGRAEVAPAQFKAQFARLVELTGPDSLDARVFRLIDDPAAAQKELRAAYDSQRKSGEPLRVIIQYADAMGDHELAMEALRSAVVSPSWRAPYELGYLLWYPYKTGLRADPRFKQLLREIGLVDYWRTTGNWGDYCSPTGPEDFECR